MIRPLNPKVKTILKVAISLAVVAFVLFIWANARPVPIQVGVTFTSYTNDATLPKTWANFCVSNAGRCSVYDNAPHRVEIKNQQLGGFLLVETGELKPGEFTTISLPPPEIRAHVDDRGSLVPRANLEPWRLKLSFSKVDWREKLVRNPPAVLRKVLQFVPAKWLERHPIEIHSDWINGPELMPFANTTNSPPK